MFVFLRDVGVRSRIVFLFWVILFFTGLSFSFKSTQGFSIQAERKPNGRIDITYISGSSEPVTAGPVSDILYIPEEEDGGGGELIIRTTLFGDIKVIAPELPESKKQLIHGELKIFISETGSEEYGRSFTGSIFFRIFGTLIALLAGFYSYKSFKMMPSISKDDLGKITDLVKGSVGKVLSLVKKIQQDKPKTVVKKQARVSETDTFTEKLLKVIVIGCGDHNPIEPEMFDIPGLNSITVACSKKQRELIESKHGKQYDVINKETSGSDVQILLAYAEKIKDFAGYVIVKTGHIPQLNRDMVNGFYKYHREKNNECSLLSTSEDKEGNASGKILRNMANRITGIGNQDEAGGGSDVCELFAGLYCFNTKKLNDTLKKLHTSMPGKPLNAIVELYSRNGFRTNSFPLSGPIRSKPSAIIANENIFTPSVQIVKTAALIISSHRNEPSSVLNLYEAVNIPEINDVFIIAKKEFADEYKELLADKARVIPTDNDIGDGYDALKAYDFLKDHRGNVIVVPETDYDLTAGTVNKLINYHSFRTNTCTAVMRSDEPVLYLVKTDYLTYSVKRIIKDDDTKKYLLSQITQILTDDKKQVELVPEEELLI